MEGNKRKRVACHIQEGYGLVTDGTQLLHIKPGFPFTFSWKKGHYGELHDADPNLCAEHAPGGSEHPLWIHPQLEVWRTLNKLGLFARIIAWQNWCNASCERSDQQPALPRQPLNHVPQSHICTSFKHLWAWWPHSFSGQPVPIPNHPFNEEVFPNIQYWPLLAEFEAVCSCPVAGYLGEEINLLMAGKEGTNISIHGAVCSHCLGMRVPWMAHQAALLCAITGWHCSVLFGWQLARWDFQMLREVGSAGVQGRILLLKHGRLLPILLWHIWDICTVLTGITQHLWETPLLECQMEAR